MTRRLVLRRETLADLSAAELAGVAGGQLVPTWDVCPLTGPYQTLPVRDCVLGDGRKTH